MKTLSSVLFALVLSTTAALADDNDFGWDRGDRGPGWGHPGRGVCTVTFKKCDFNINGFCVKWNNKGFQVGWRESRWACQRAEQEYGMIRNCRVQCR
jgi:hypothetical protein